MQRVLEFLEIVKILNRNIRGRQENLSPVFAIGGIYDIANPYFLGRIKLNSSKEGFKIDTKVIDDVLESTFLGNNIKDDTYVGINEGCFVNKNKFEEKLGDRVLGVNSFFDNLIKSVKEYYGVQEYEGITFRLISRDSLLQKAFCNKNI